MDRRRNSVVFPHPPVGGVPVLPVLHAKTAPVDVKSTNQTVPVEAKTIGLKTLQSNNSSLSEKVDALTVKVEALSRRKVCECDNVDKKYSGEVASLKKALKDLIEN